jgi:isopentenyl diphosphate isomerase/L-lactate dehydrogenase-like FMN-dependent dehydrogenase
LPNDGQSRNLSVISASDKNEERFQTLHEIVQAARANVDENLWDYIVGGSETETTLLRNRHALDRIAFRPRVLRDVSSLQSTGTFFGRDVRLPIVLAPVGGLDALAADGAKAVAIAATRFGVPFYLSAVRDVNIETVAAAGAGPKVLQLYARGDDAWIDGFVWRAVDAGFDAICITVDSAIYSRRERDIVKRFVKPWVGHGAEFQAALNWDSIRRFKDRHHLPLILKGISTPEDADIACGLGVEAIYVSNHGGRQLDHCLGAVETLPDIVAAVAGRSHVFVDGGFSRGSDIVKAIALGADSVGIGRLLCYGLVAAGAEGIVRVLELLELEVVQCLGLLGVTSFSALDRTYLAATEAVALPTLHSAFPLLNS